MKKKARTDTKPKPLSSKSAEILLDRWGGFKTYSIVNAQELEGLLPTAPEKYLDRCNKVLVMSSGIGSTAFMAFDFYRVEGEKLDRDPHLVIVDQSEPLSGTVYHLTHAAYSGRTADQSPKFRGGVIVSGVQTVAPIPELPSKDSGNIDELTPGQRAGFDHAEEFVRVEILGSRKD